MNPNPSDLVARAQNGNSDAIGSLYALYHPRIYRYLYYRTADLQTAEELTADVFLKMIQALPHYRNENIPILAWLFQIARNLAIDHYRRTGTYQIEVIQEDLDDGDGVEYELDRQLNAEILAEALAELEDLQRDVILLRFIEEMPIQEVAVALHKSIDAVKGLQRRGLISLRRKFYLQEEKHD